MKKLGLKLFVGAAASLFLAQEAMAIPAFARQMGGVSCTTCHTHHVPILNSYGKQFKLSGYTMSSDMGAQKLITDKSDSGETTVSLPSSFNASVLTKTRYQKKTVKDPVDAPTGSENGVIEMFDEGFIQLAGRISESWGFISEFSADGLATAKFAGSTDIAGGTGGLALFTSDGFGPFFGQELWSTGIYRPDRLFEDRKVTQAAQVTGVGAHAVTGTALSLKKDAFFVNATLFTPNTSNGNSDPDTNRVDSTPGNIAYRAAYEMHFGDVGGMIGVFGTAGKSTYGDGNVTETNQVTESFGIDTEWETHDMIANIVYLTTKGNEDGESIYANGGSDTTAIQANISYALSNKLFVKGAYLTYAVKDDDTKDFSAITPGIEYFINDNMRADFEYSMKTYANDSDSDYSNFLAMLMIVF